MTTTENRPVVDKAALEEFGGSPIKYSLPDGSHGASTPPATTTRRPAAIRSQETIVEQAASAYLMSIADDPSISLAAVRDALLAQINAEINVENTGRGGSSPHPTLQKLRTLDESTVVSALLARERIVAVDMAEGDAKDMTLLAVYSDFGEDEGTYTTSESAIRRLASSLKPSMTSRAIDSVYTRLRDAAPLVRRTIEPHLIPVANGVFDHARQALRPFSPDWVFLSKIPVDYDQNAESPIFDMHDGQQWEFESWIRSLSDDEGVPELLWEIISAAVRSYFPWKIAIWFVSERGNNGKGTLIQALRNLLGNKACSSISFADFGEPFMMTPLLESRVNLVDENDVGQLAERIKTWKAVVTGDAFTLNRKHRDPVMMRWRGLDIQCLNSTLQRTKDRSGSFYRRLRIVPFRKWFGGSERKYIKDDYLARPEVLRYMLKRSLEMQHKDLSLPPVCAQALAEYEGNNNYMLTFWNEYKDHFKWDLLPYKFLHALYVAWLSRTNPSARPEGEIAFNQFLRAHLTDSNVWEVKTTSIRPLLRMSVPEPLIAEYDLVHWSNRTYTGTDAAKRSMVSHLEENYRGLLRRDERIGRGAHSPDTASTSPTSA